jgi:hypothetical protein
MAIKACIQLCLPLSWSLLLGLFLACNNAGSEQQKNCHNCSKDGATRRSKKLTFGFRVKTRCEFRLLRILLLGRPENFFNQLIPDFSNRDRCSCP